MRLLLAVYGRGVFLPMRRDLAVPVGVALVGTTEALAAGTPHLSLVMAVEWCSAVLLVARRRRPFVAATSAGLVILSLTFVGEVVQNLASPILFLTVATFTLGRGLPDLRGLGSVLVFVGVLLGVNEAGAAETVDVSDVVFVSALTLPPYAFGRLLRAFADRNHRLAEQADLLARLQATVRQDAVDAERARIARELHDVLAHSLSAMTLQASAAEDVLRTDPDRAARAMHDVAETGRRALAETGRLLHLVRDSDDELGLGPDLGLSRLEELVEQFRRAGLAVDLQVTGLAGLPAGVDLSGYRILQEALTNALKYAVDRAVTVRVEADAVELRLQVENRGRPGPGVGGGLGLVGMAERVQVYGGRLEHGFTRDGRFLLQVSLPLATDRSLTPAP